MHSTYAGDMPVNITIRAVPDDVRDELAARARRAGQSLQEYLSAQLTALASKPTQREVLLAAREAAHGYPPIGTDDILAALDADRR
jgi:plasmid stability protein